MRRDPAEMLKRGDRVVYPIMIGDDNDAPLWNVAVFLGMNWNGRYPRLLTSHGGTGEYSAKVTYKYPSRLIAFTTNEEARAYIEERNRIRGVYLQRLRKLREWRHGEEVAHDVRSFEIGPVAPEEPEILH